MPEPRRIASRSRTTVVIATRDRPEELLTTLDRLADALVERETLDTPQLLEIFGHLPVWSGNGSQPIVAAVEGTTPTSSSTSGSAPT